MLLGQLLVLSFVLGGSFPSLAARLADAKRRDFVADWDANTLSTVNGFSRLFLRRGLGNWPRERVLLCAFKKKLALSVRHHVTLFSRATVHAAILLLGATARLETADMLLAFAGFVCVLEVAIDQRVDGEVLIAGARLLACVLLGVSARNSNNLTALLVGTARDRTHAGLGLRVQNLLRTVVRSVNIAVLGSREAVNFSAHCTTCCAGHL